MLRISWTEKKTNDWVLNKAESCNSRLLNVINRRNLSFAGHVLRSNGLDKTLLIGMVFGNRGRGRPKTRFSNSIKEISGGLSLVSSCKIGLIGESFCGGSRQFSPMNLPSLNDDGVLLDFWFCDECYCKCVWPYTQVVTQHRRQESVIVGIY